MEKDEDQRLYADFLKGDKEAFEKIIRKYAERIIYFIYSFTNDIDISKDISQNVFLYVLLHKEKYKFKCSVKTYLYIIAKSQSLNYIKHEKKKENLKIECIQENELLLDLESVIFDNLEKQELKNAINLLPKKSGKMIYLAYIEDIPYKEIAKILNTNIGQVKTNIHRGKKKLEEILKKEGENYV